MASCPLCRELLGSTEALFTCSGCDVGYHEACTVELDRCGTLGCASPDWPETEGALGPRVRPPAAKEASVRPGERQGRADLVPRPVPPPRGLRSVLGLTSAERALTLAATAVHTLVSYPFARWAFGHGAMVDLEAIGNAWGRSAAGTLALLVVGSGLASWGWLQLDACNRFRLGGGRRGGCTGVLVYPLGALLLLPFAGLVYWALFGRREPDAD